MSYAVLLDEAQRMPDASIRLARDVSYVVETPRHLLDLRTRIRIEHRGQLLALHWQINRRFRTTAAQNNYVNVFYAASEMALMEAIGRNELSQDDCMTLRRLWNALLSAT